MRMHIRFLSFDAVRLGMPKSFTLTPTVMRIVVFVHADISARGKIGSGASTDDIAFMYVLPLTFLHPET